MSASRRGEVTEETEDAETEGTEKRINAEERRYWEKGRNACTRIVFRSSAAPWPPLLRVKAFLRTLRCPLSPPHTPYALFDRFTPLPSAETATNPRLSPRNTGEFGRIKCCVSFEHGRQSRRLRAHYRPGDRIR